MKTTTRKRLFRNRTAIFALVVAGLIWVALPARLVATEVYVVRFLTTNIDTCPGAAYRDQLAFRNTTGQDLVVRALEGSNGYNPPEDPLSVPAGRSRAVF